jgi:hypothetical protein
LWVQDDDGKEESKAASKSDEAAADRPSSPEDGSETKVAEATAVDKDTEMADALEKVIVTLCSCLCCFHLARNLHDKKHNC